MTRRSGKDREGRRPRWRRPLLLLAVAVVLLVVDWRLAILLRRERLEEFAEPVEIAVRPGEELVVVGSPDDDELVRFDPKAGDGDVGVFLTGSRLSESTIRRVRGSGGGGPAEGQEIALTTGTPADAPGGEGGLRCRTTVTVTRAGGPDDSPRLHLFQPASREDAPEVTLRPEGAALRVGVAVLVPPGADPAGNTIGCLKEVSVDDSPWIPLPAPLHFEAVVRPGGTATFGFYGRPGAAEGVAPFELGSVRSVEVRPCLSCEPLVRAPGLGGADVTVRNLEILPAELRVALEGKGPLERASRYLLEDRTFTGRVKYWIQYHPILAILWVALTGWFLSLVTRHVFERPATTAWRRFRGEGAEEDDSRTAEPRDARPPAEPPGDGSGA